METELWRQCVRWLMDTGVLPRQHRTQQRHAAVFDLAQTLRDGVVLCNLLNAIHPGAVDFSRINLRPQMLQFLCMQNIISVLEALETVFYIPREELFEPEDLYKMTNFPQVLRVLSILSQCPDAQKKYLPFPETQYMGSRSFARDEEDEIYRNLPDLASERELADEEDLYDSVAEEKEEEGIYGSLIAAKPSISPSKDKRSCCINEVIETERNYVQHLDMMIKKFMHPLQNHLQLKDLKTIFMNIDTLLTIHNTFFNELQAAKNMSAKLMSQPFLRQRESFLQYGTYCSGLTDAQDLLEELMKKEDMRMFIEELQNKANPSKFKLRELLCVPMQRVLKYHLLVKELNKHTPDGHQDKKDMAKALEAMQEVSHYVNEVKRDSEMLININKVDSCLTDYNMQTPLYHYGRLLKDGELKIKGAQDKNPKSRNAFLFDQALFMTKSEKSGSYSLKDLVRLKEYRIDEMQLSIKGGKWSWSITLSGISSGTFVLYAKTESERSKWLECLKNAFDNINPHAIKSKSHSFKMHTFIEPTYCSYCKKLFLGTFYQGYVCAKTGAKSHKGCLAETLKLIETNKLGIQGSIPTEEGRPPVPARKGITRPDRQPPPPRPVSVPAFESSKPYRAHRDYNGHPNPPYPGVPFITFSVSEQIEVTDQPTPDWWMGYSIMQTDRRGYFPASHVSPVTKRLSTVKPHTSNYLPTNPHIHAFSSSGSVKHSSTSQPILEEAPWYAGVMDRGGAENVLNGKPSGTFLIRTRDGHLAISLCYNSDMKHIKINQTSDNLYYVAECRNFRSVQDLVKYYQDNSMSSSFLGLETTLKIPYRDPNFFPNHRPSHHPPSIERPLPPPSYRQSPKHPHLPNGMQNININAGQDAPQFEAVCKVRVLFDFEPRSPQEIALRQGQIVNVISKAGDSRGWWKGEYDGKVGYFPCSFIEQLD